MCRLRYRPVTDGEHRGQQYGIVHSRVGRRRGAGTAGAEQCNWDDVWGGAGPVQKKMASVYHIYEPVSRYWKQIHESLCML